MDNLQMLKIEVKGWAGVDEVVVLNPPSWLIEFWSTENGEGKTSLLGAVKLALGGGRLPDRVIRDGATAAEVNIDLGACALHCTVETQKGRALSLKVRNPEGKLMAWPKAPQGYLDGLVGKMLDPGGFQDLDEEKQQALVHELADPVWLARRAELERAVGNAEIERTEAGREVRRIGEVLPVDEVKAVDVAALAAEISRIEAENRKSAEAYAAWKREAAAAHVDYERREAEALAAWQREQESRAQHLETAAQGLSLLAGTVERLKKQLAEAENDLFLAKQQASLLPRPEQLPPPVRGPEPTVGTAPEVVELGTADLQQQLAEANERNKAAALYTRYLERRTEQEQAVAMHAATEAAVAATRMALAEHDRLVELPEGLAILDKGLSYAGRPLHRMSTGEGDRMGFAIAARRGQQILIWDNAESAGPRTVQSIAALAAEFKIWVVMATRGTPHTPGAYELRNGRLA